MADTYRQSGLKGCLRKISAAISMNLPLLFLGRRTNKSVGAYFDLITDDARMFYGDNFHFGYFPTGSETFEEALNAHTDLVCQMARLDEARNVLDIGCGIGSPAVRVAKRHSCSLTGINISREQVRQGRELVAKNGLTDRISLREGNALDLPFDQDSFDAILCLEVAGDICVTPEQKTQLIAEMHRVLKPGGWLGFSDLVFTGLPSREEEKAMRMVLYHKGEELVTDWPALFEKQGFTIRQKMDILPQTMKTWEHSLAVYQQNTEIVNRRYGKKIAQKTQQHLRQIPEILAKHGSFVVLSVQK
ncbi:MAG: methyltransferase domain-containing protein [Deltaproteobacteria bacterium]|nr:methyltransferase domain-containing protein [Deltaproteobacteria bacterium]